MKKWIFIFAIILIGLVLLSLKKEVTFTLNGEEHELLSVNSTYQEKGIKKCTKNILNKVACEQLKEEYIVEDKTDNSTLGTYQEIYNINYKNKSYDLIRKIEVIDDIKPVIELEPDDDLTCSNKPYQEKGYKATDNYDGDITDKVKTSENNGIITYTVTDNSNNTTEIKRTINHGDSQEPDIVLKGNPTVYIILGDKYVEKGYNVTDNCDNNVSVNVKNNIDINKIGNYEVIYEAKDSSGNYKKITRKVVVIKKQEDNVINPGNKVIYLTFDDGPGQYTNRLLDILDTYNVKATFFVTGQYYKYLNILSRQNDLGHSIGVHTFSHQYKKIYSSIENYLNDFNKIENEIFNYTGIHTKIFRFPGGSSNTVSNFNKGIITSLSYEMSDKGYEYFDWNVASNDTSTSDTNKIANNIIEGIKKNNVSVVLQHDIKKNSVEAVPIVIEWGLANGYTFLGLDITSPKIRHVINN